MNHKNVLRKQVKDTLAQLSKPLYDEYSHKIACRLFDDENWKEASIIGMTISRHPEVDTYQIIRKSWEEGKQIVVPKCEPKEKRLSFRTLTDFSQLESVFYGLLEPIEALTTKMEGDSIDLLIVPGLAYTRDGYRLGFGGGYYDRFLSNFTGKTVSLAFSDQIISELPVENHDIPVSKIITNHEVILIND